jgi:hypothetical protein
MKQKLANRIKIFKFVFLIFFVLAELFGFGTLDKVSAASATGDCFNIDGMQAEQGQITKTSTSIFDFKVSRNSSTGQCRTRTTPSVVMLIKQSGMFTPDITLTKATLDFSNLSTPSITSSISYNWSQLPSDAWNNLPNANTIDYYMRIDYYSGEYADSAFSGADTHSWGKQLDIVISLPSTNPTTTSSSPKASPNKSSYAIGETMTITFSGLPTGSSGQACVNYTAGSSNCFTLDPGETSMDIAVTTDNGFNATGANSITIDNFKDGSGNAISFQGGNSFSVTTAAAATNPNSTPTNTGTVAAGGACTGSGQGNCAANLTCTNSVCVSSGQNANSGTVLFNPLPEADLVHVFLLVAQGFLAILGILAAVFIIVGGFEMVIASGNEEAYLKAKKTIIWAVLGLVVATLSFSIIAIVEDFLGVNIPAATTSTPTTLPSTPTTLPSTPTTAQ